jgi:hypothetical protein
MFISGSIAQLRPPIGRQHRIAGAIDHSETPRRTHKSFIHSRVALWRVISKCIVARWSVVCAADSAGAPSANRAFAGGVEIHVIHRQQQPGGGDLLAARSNVKTVYERNVAPRWVRSGFVQRAVLAPARWSGTANCLLSSASLGRRSSMANRRTQLRHGWIYIWASRCHLSDI